MKEETGSLRLGSWGNGFKKSVPEGTGNAVEAGARVPSSSTKVTRAPEVKSPVSVKATEATGQWDEFLGEGQTNINPLTKQPDPNRIFSADGTRSIRFGNHEMNSMNTTKFHYHEENWMFDPVNDTMTVNNTLKRVR